MILLSKKEKELKKEDRLKLEIMKTLAIAKGYDPKDDKITLDFRDGSAFEKASRFLTAKFNISLKKGNLDPEIDLEAKNDGINEAEVGIEAKVTDSKEKDGINVINNADLEKVSINKPKKPASKKKPGASSKK